MHCGYALTHSGIESVQTPFPHRVYVRSRWTLKIALNIKHYLSERDVVASNALKKDLVARCRAACLLNLQPKANITLEEYNEDIANQRL